MGRIYWDYGLLANRSSDGWTYFHHSNYLGTARARTDYQGNVGNQERSLDFGDGFSQTASNGSTAAQDNANFTGQEHDFESGTEHFLYRQYSSTSGCWMSPDPYGGSYDVGNPQSFNRYSYVLNNPLALIDPLGLDYG